MSVPHALLALLSEGPKYGLQLREEFEARTGEVWPLNVGQVYTTLQRLERDGLVESDGAGARAASTRASGSPWRARTSWPGWLRTPPDLASPPRDELVIKVLVALRVPGVDVPDGAAGAPQVPGPAHAAVDPDQGGRRREDDLGLALAVDAELFRLDSVIRWLDSAESRIRRTRPARPAKPVAPAAQAAPPGGGAAMTALELAAGIQDLR